MLPIRGDGSDSSRVVVLGTAAVTAAMDAAGGDGHRTAHTAVSPITLIL
jgi:hypothetical protein